ncbi:hypothetical protein JYU34_004870 [Plutella xylostella]|uniref:Uncharacterized protein n=1 Tax=Plutella xylostella TaxID=51655 RepID=A0ABQ7QVG2_PLUXY|nr:hypothetical protein JYU34_004870 [Plutella xylostella]
MSRFSWHQMRKPRWSASACAFSTNTWRHCSSWYRMSGREVLLSSWGGEIWG